MNDERPRAAASLEAHEVDDGLVVYDSDHDRVHYLNATASVVFTLSDGTRSIAEIAELVARAWDLAEPPLGDVIDCVVRLRDEGVLVD